MSIRPTGGGTPPLRKDAETERELWEKKELV